MKLPKEGSGEPLLLIGIHVFLFLSVKKGPLKRSQSKLLRRDTFKNHSKDAKMNR